MPPVTPINPTESIQTGNMPQSGILNAKISSPLSVSPRPIPVLSSRKARTDMQNKKLQYGQLMQDIQSQRQNVQAINQRKQQQQTIQSIIQRTPPIEPEKQMDDILKDLTDL